MGWGGKFIMSILKVGQRARCIKPYNPRPNAEGGGGSGWEDGMEFEITKITEETDIPIYWPKALGGIYEDWVESAEKWDGKDNKNYRR